MSQDKGIILQPSQSSLIDLSSRIYTIRGVQVMFDVDLADLYQVQTRIIKRQVRANIDRFPDDFMFELTSEELESLRSKFRISNIKNTILTRSLRSKFRISNEGERPGRGGTRVAPFAFTEAGVGTLSGILKSKKAAILNVAIMRAFIHFRRNIELAQPHFANELQLMRSDFADLKQRFEQLDTFLRSRPQSLLPLQSEKPNNVQIILDTVAKYWSLSVDDLKSPSRSKAICQARQVAIFFIRKHLRLGFAEIGHLFGHRDHTTIMHSYKKVDSDDSDFFRAIISNLGGKLGAVIAA